MKVGTLLRYATLTIPAVTAYSAAMEIVFWAKKDIVGNVNVTSQEEASERIADVSRAWNTWDSPDTDPKEVCIDDLGGLIYPLYLEECQERPMYSPVAVFPDFDIEKQDVNVTFPEYTLVCNMTVTSGGRASWMLDGGLTVDGDNNNIKITCRNETNGD